MEDSKQPKPEPQPIPAEQAAEISGGADSCPVTTTVTLGPFTFSGSSPADVGNAIYDGAVDVTSHVIETVVKSAKS
jgi:hypothetical protein